MPSDMTMKRPDPRIGRVDLHNHVPLRLQKLHSPSSLRWLDQGVVRWLGAHPSDSHQAQWCPAWCKSQERTWPVVGDWEYGFALLAVRAPQLLAESCNGRAGAWRVPNSDAPFVTVWEGWLQYLILKWNWEELPWHWCRSGGLPQRTWKKII